MIEAKELTKRYGETVAINEVSFKVSKGEVVGFLGPNGAGKTTTMKILTGYMPPDKGTALINDMVVQEKPVQVKQCIGYLPEDNPLYEDMGVYDYLSFIADIRAIDKQEKTRRITEMIEVCGLQRVVSKDIYELSKGYRQRLGLAQTLIHSPDILILDEPTAGLDPNQIIEIRNLIREIGKQKTTILCTHILSEVQATCNRSIIINEGRIVAQGTPEEISQRARGNQVIYITVRGRQEALQEELTKLPQVLSAKHLRALEPDRHRFVLSAATEKDINEDIFIWAKDNDHILSEIHAESSFEKAFMKLTMGENKDA